MKNKLYQVLLLVLSTPLALMAKGGFPLTNTPVLSGSTADRIKKEEGYSGKKLLFIENKGQVKDQNLHPRTDIQFALPATGGLNIFVGSGAIYYQFSKCNEATTPGAPASGNTSFTMYRMDVELIGANKHAEIITGEQQEYYENYFTTGENSNITHAYNRITYKNVYPGIDWVLYTKGGTLEHEFVVRPGGKVSDIKLKYGGATDLKLAANGDLIANTPQGMVTEHAPYTYQKDGSTISSKFLLKGNILSYETGVYSGELVLDPNIAWATYYGGNDRDWGISVTTDNSGNIYMAGRANSTSGIATTGSYQSTHNGGFEAYLVKFNSSGVRQWATYYGSNGDEVAYSVVTDRSGNVYMSGYTTSTSGIATPSAYQANYSGGWDVFLVKFNGAGARQWGTYYGGSNDEVAYAMAIDANGNLYLTGRTKSASGIATSGSYQNTFGGGTGTGDCFLVKFNGAGARVWGTYYGGSSDEAAWSVTTDRGGSVYIAAWATGSGLASPGAYQAAPAGGQDGLLVKFNSLGARQWATYYGGAGTENAMAVTTDASGNVYMGGSTNSPSGIATTGSYQETINGVSDDAFLVKFNSSGSRVWGTYYGGTDVESVSYLASDVVGNIFMIGVTNSSSGIATTGSLQETYAGNGDGYLVKFTGIGTREWATYYGGGNNDITYCITRDMDGNMYLCGLTNSTSGIATPGAFQSTLTGTEFDAFLVKLYNVAPITGNLGMCVGTNSVLPCPAPNGLAWTSNDTTVAKVGITSGVVIPVSSGTSTITFMAKSGAYSTAIVTINPQPTPISGTTVICQGSTTSLSSTGTTGGTWVSSRMSVGVIGSVSGILTGRGGGTTTVTYTHTNGCSQTTVITVNPLPIAGAIVGAGTFLVGTTVPLASNSPGGTWASANAAIATITPSTGMLTGITPGNVIISYTQVNGCGTATVTRIFTVTSPKPGMPDEGNNNNDVVFSLYPNPTSGALTIETKITGVLTLFSIDGRLESSYSIKENTTRLSLPGNLATGIFICRFDGDDGSSKVVRVVYQK